MEKLVVDWYRGAYRILWQFEYDYGAVLGENKDDGMGNLPSEPEARPHWLACKAILEAFPGIDRDYTGFLWESETGAKKALRLAKAAIKGVDRPMPEWAITALAHGWKAPKGWKP